MSLLRARMPLLRLSPFSTFVQVGERTGAKAQDQLPSRWSAGLAVAHRHRGCAGAGTRTRLSAVVAYGSDRCRPRGVAPGYRARAHGRVALRTFVAGRMDGLDAEDSGIAEWARRSAPVRRHPARLSTVRSHVFPWSSP